MYTHTRAHSHTFAPAGRIITRGRVALDFFHLVQLKKNNNNRIFSVSVRDVFRVHIIRVSSHSTLARIRNSFFLAVCNLPLVD